MAELSEVFDQTQTAIAGWRKILGVLAMPVDVVDPEPGRRCPPGPLGIEVSGRRRSRTAPARRSCASVDVSIPAGTNVAVVGETGSGKTTFATLLCRLADPTDGVDPHRRRRPARRVGADARHRAIRMVPQDGFLFDTTIADNVRLGRDGADRRRRRGAFAALGLDDWLAAPARRASQTQVGERGIEPVGRRTPARGAGPGPARRTRAC